MPPNLCSSVCHRRSVAAVFARSVALAVEGTEAFAVFGKYHHVSVERVDEVIVIHYSRQVQTADEGRVGGFGMKDKPHVKYAVDFSGVFSIDVGGKVDYRQSPFFRSA